MEEIKSQFIQAFLENDDLALFFAFQRLCQAYKSKDITKQEFREVIFLIGGNFTIGDKDYELQ